MSLIKLSFFYPYIISLYSVGNGFENILRKTIVVNYYLRLLKCRRARSNYEEIEES